MKVNAHPMVVAVAMGLLSPQLLLEDDDRRGERCEPAGVRCDTCGAVAGEGCGESESVELSALELGAPALD